jgi:hypothetical protein
MSQKPIRGGNAMEFINVMQAAEKAGFQSPVFVSERLYREFIKPPEAVERLGQTTEDRLGIMLSVFRRFLGQRKPDAPADCFEVVFRMGVSISSIVRLKYAVCEGKGRNPAVRIMLHDETCDE